MPKLSPRPRSATPSPAEMTLQLLEGMLHRHKMDVHAKLAALRELCVERISFNSPAQGVRIISSLAEIISTDPEAEVRVAALEAMERMISLEQKAEAELGKPEIDWRTVNLLLHRARKQTALDTAPVASRSGAPSPESPVPQPVRNSIPVPPPAPDAKPVTDADIAPAEAALLAVQEAAVGAIKQGNPPVVPPPSPAPVASAATAPSPVAAPSPQPEPPIMKFLRAIAETDAEEQNIRELANRIIARIESLTALRPGTAHAPALTEG